MTAPIAIPAIAPPDSFDFDDDVDEAGVFEEVEDEAPVGETPIVATDAIDVPTVTSEGDAVDETAETINDVLGAAVVLTAALVDANSDAHARSSVEVYCVGVPVDVQPFMKSPIVTAVSCCPQFLTIHCPTAFI